MYNTRITRLLKFLEEDPRDPFVRFALATEHAKAGCLEQALERFEALVVDSPDYIGTYYHLGKLYVRLGRIQEARDTFETGVTAAAEVNDFHTISELRSAIMMLEESDELV